MIYFNEESENAYGHDADAVIGEDVYEVFQTEGESEILCQTVARKNEVIREQDPRKVPKAGGGYRYNRAMGVPLTDPEGDVVGAFEMTVGVTDLVKQQKRMEDAQETMSEEVTERVREGEEVSERARENILESKSQAQEQADSMEEVAEEISNLSASIEEVAASAENVNELSQQAESLADESKEQG